MDPHEATLKVEATRDPLVHALAEPRETPAGLLMVAHPAIVSRDLEGLSRGDERVAEMLDRLHDSMVIERTRDAPR